VIFPQAVFNDLSNAVEQFNAILDAQIGLALQGIKYQPYPIESTVALSTQCFSSTIDETACFWPMFSTDKVGSALANELGPRSLESPAIPSSLVVSQCWKRSIMGMIRVLYYTSISSQNLIDSLLHLQYIIFQLNYMYYFQQSVLLYPS
jgi:hypothetical protein